MKLAAERRGQPADEEQLSGPVKAPGVTVIGREMLKGAADGRVSGKRKERARELPARLLGLLLTRSRYCSWTSPSAHKHLRHGLRSPPRTMNLQRNALKSVAASTKRAK